jgi:hypothetical protein
MVVFLWRRVNGVIAGNYPTNTVPEPSRLDAPVPNKPSRRALRPAANEWAAQRILVVLAHGSLVHLRWTPLGTETLNGPATSQSER